MSKQQATVRADNDAEHVRGQTELAIVLGHKESILAYMLPIGKEPCIALPSLPKSRSSSGPERPGSYSSRHADANS